MDFDHFCEWRIGIIERKLAAVDRRIFTRRQERLSETLRGLDADVKIMGYCGAFGHRRANLEQLERRAH